MQRGWNRASLAGLGCFACVLCAASSPAQTPFGDQPPASAPTQEQNPAPGRPEPGAGTQAASPAAPTGLWERPNLLGGIGGLRPLLGDHGITIGLSETSEVFGNATGGVRRGADYDGLTQMGLGIDTAKAFGWQGGTFNISALQIHGRNLTSDNLTTIQTITSIEAERATRIWELWYQQAFSGGNFDIKIGQQSLDQEFMTSQGSGLFINSSFGWPLLTAVDLYAGGPAYPLSSLGVRLRGQPMENVTVLGGVFDDNPPGGPFGDDSQTRGREASGTRFDLGTGALFIAELQYALNPPPQAGAAAAGSQAPAPPAGLPGVYKLGFWYDSGSFPDQRFDAIGRSLADPASTGDRRMHHGNFSLYAVMDQMVWRPDPQGARAVGVFARAMGAPADRNLVNYFVSAGVTLKAPLPGRDNDSVGVSFGYGHVSGADAALDRDTIRFSQSAIPIRTSDTVVELTYQAQVAPWWIVQPDLQYIFNPGGGIPSPNNPAQRSGNELVLGLRTNITF